MEVGIADSASLSAGRSDLKLTDIHPEFNELKVGKKIKANHSGGSPQARPSKIAPRKEIDKKLDDYFGGVI